jgi:hypothetical protein
VVSDGTLHIEGQLEVGAEITLHSSRAAKRDVRRGRGPALIGTGGITPDLLAPQRENLTPKNHVIQKVREATEGEHLSWSSREETRPPSSGDMIPYKVKIVARISENRGEQSLSRTDYRSPRKLWDQYPSG